MTTLKRRIDGVFLRVHKDDSDILEIYTKRHEKTIIWGIVSEEMLSEMKGGISAKDLENHEYEILIHFPGGRKYPHLEDL